MSKSIERHSSAAARQAAFETRRYHEDDFRHGDGPGGVPVVVGLDGSIQGLRDWVMHGASRHAAEHPYSRNNDGVRQHAPAGHGQDIEPWGRYMNPGHGGAEHWERGYADFDNPLTVEAEDWKQALSDQYGGATGQGLSDALLADGYDAVLSHHPKYGPGEMVDVRPKGQRRYRQAKKEQCEYCSAPATQEILHSEGMAYTPVCDKHLRDGTDDAEHCTPDGSYDPSNIVRIDKIAEQHRYGPDDYQRTDAHDLVEYRPGYAREELRAEDLDQTPIRPGPWYHVTRSPGVKPGTILDPYQPNNFNYYSEELRPRDRWVFMHHDPEAALIYGDNVWEVEPIGDGPYAYNGEDKAWTDGWVAPKAKVLRKYTPPRPTDDPGVQSFADAMARMGNQRTAMPAPGVIHRGLTLDLSAPPGTWGAASQQLRDLLKTHGPESPEFVEELLRNGTGSYWTRDKGIAESINATPGNGLQVVFSADWDGNDAQPLHDENIRKLPDSWGDMSLLAPQENAVSEFNLKPGKELPINSIRVRPKGEKAWREILRQPTRARTSAKIKIVAMPRDQALVDRLRFEHRDTGDGFSEVNAYDGDTYVGTVGWDSAGKIADAWVPDDAYRRRGVATSILEHARGIRPDIHHSDVLSEAGLPWAKSDPLYVEHPNRQRVVEDMARRVLDWSEHRDEPWARAPAVQRTIDLFNKGQDSALNPGVREFSDHMEVSAALHTAMPRRDYYDLNEDSSAPDQAPVRPGPWYHGSPQELAVGDILRADAPNRFDYGTDGFGSASWSPRDTKVFLSPDINVAESYADSGRWGTGYLYEVEPIGDEGPFPWNGMADPGQHGYAAPGARVKAVIPRRTWDEYVDSSNETAAKPPAVGNGYFAGSKTTDQSMVLGMLSIDDLVRVAHTVKGLENG